MAAPYLIGIDGGGSGTRARLTDGAGRVLGHGGAGPSAPQVSRKASSSDDLHLHV